MAEAQFEIQRRHVLGGLDEVPAASDRPARKNDFQMRRAGDVTRHVLRLDPAIAAQRGEVLGFDVRQAINMAHGQETLLTDTPRASLRLGPDEWLLIGTPAAEADQASLKTVDVSHRNIAIEVRGCAVRDVLNTGIALDLDEAVFRIGTATRTVFAKAEIVLVHCRDASGDSVFRIECWRSFGRYLVAHLAQSARLLGLPTP